MFKKCPFGFGSKKNSIAAAQEVALSNERKVELSYQNEAKLINYINLTQESLTELASAVHVVDQVLDRIVDAFYAQVLKVPELRAIIDRESTLPVMKKNMRNYLHQLFAAPIDEEYVEYRKLVGRVHERIQLKPHWYIGAYQILNELIIPTLVHHYHHDPQKLSRMIVAYNGKVNFDSQIILEEYFSTYVNKIQDIVDRLKTTQMELTSLSQELAAFTQQSQASFEEASAVAQTVIEDLNSTLTESRDVYVRSQHSSQLMESMVESSQGMLDQMQVAMRQVEKLTESSRNINAMVQTIGTISGQTNLLALNAAIEAARAGDHGRGFSVVANEVRVLADGSKQASQEITSQVGESLNNIDTVITQLASISSYTENFYTQTEQTTEEIVLVMNSLQKSMNSFQENIQALNTIMRMLEEMNHVTEQIATMACKLVEISDEVTRL